MATNRDGVDEGIGTIDSRKRPATILTAAMAAGDDGVDEEIATNGARKRPATISTTDEDGVDVERDMSDSTISTDREIDVEVVDQETFSNGARKRPATISTDMTTDGDGVDEEMGMSDSTISTDTETEGEVVGHETHGDLFLRRPNGSWRKELAPPIEEAPPRDLFLRRPDGSWRKELAPPIEEAPPRDLFLRRPNGSWRKELAPPIEEAPPEERRRDLLGDSGRPLNIEKGDHVDLQCDSATSTDTETEEEVVGHETHGDTCFCQRDWSWREERAPLIEEAPPEESLRGLLHSPGRPLKIEKGDHVDLQQLLFTPDRDYLMKSNGEKVHKDDLLNNKYLLLYIFPLVDNIDLRVNTRELIELRNLLRDKAFEIVFVGLDSGEDLSKQKKYFEGHASQMTWPFIPFENHNARERVRSAFGFPEGFVMEYIYDYPYLGIVDVDSHGKLLQSWAWEMLNYYGHDAFPFTDEKIISLYKEEASTFTEGLSLKALLGTSDRDYVLSPEGDKVPIQNLEDKVVCIILDDPTCGNRRRFVESAFDDAELHSQPDFFPVYVCRHFTTTICRREYFENEVAAKVACKSVDWHRIPCGDSSARKIWRVILRRCRRSVGGTYCNIVGPRGGYVNSRALYCIEDFGMEAYPFSVEKCKEMQSRELEHQLEDILQPACRVIRDGGLISVVLHSDCLIPCGAMKVGNASVLYNKRLLVLYGTHYCWELGQFLCELKLLYNQKKGTDEEFEVIYISFDCLLSDFVKSTSRMPWVVLPFGQKDVVMKFHVFQKRPWYCNTPAITAFERDGVLVGMEGNLHLKKDKPADFPYVNSVADEYFKISESRLPKIRKNFRFWLDF